MVQREQRYGRIARAWDDRPGLMWAVLLASLVCEAGAVFLWSTSLPLALSVHAGLLVPIAIVLFGRVWTSNS